MRAAVLRPTKLSALSSCFSPPFFHLLNCLSRFLISLLPPRGQDGQHVRRGTRCPGRLLRAYTVYLKLTSAVSGHRSMARRKLCYRRSPRSLMFYLVYHSLLRLGHLQDQLLVRHFYLRCDGRRQADHPLPNSLLCAELGAAYQYFNNYQDQYILQALLRLA